MQIFEYIMMDSSTYVLMEGYNKYCTPRVMYLSALWVVRRTAVRVNYSTCTMYEY